jgi:hypothetical protein
LPFCDVRYEFCMKPIFGSSNYLQFFVEELTIRSCLYNLRYLCVFTYSGVQHIPVLCCVFVLLVFDLVHHIMPVSLDCRFVIAPSVFSNMCNGQMCNMTGSPHDWIELIRIHKKCTFNDAA